MPLDELICLVPEAIEDSEWLEERRQKLLLLIAREYERAGEGAKALAMYLECRYRGARTRAMRLKCKAQDWEGARSLCVLAQGESGERSGTAATAACVTANSSQTWNTECASETIRGRPFRNLRLFLTGRASAAASGGASRAGSFRARSSAIAAR